MDEKRNLDERCRQLAASAQDTDERAIRSLCSQGLAELLICVAAPHESFEKEVEAATAALGRTTAELTFLAYRLELDKEAILLTANRELGIAGNPGPDDWLRQVQQRLRTLYGNAGTAESRRDLAGVCIDMMQECGRILTDESAATEELERVLGTATVTMLALQYVLYFIDPQEVNRAEADGLDRLEARLSVL